MKSIKPFQIGVFTLLFCILSIITNAKVPVLYNGHPIYNVVGVNVTDTATILTLEVKSQWETNAIVANPFLNFKSKAPGKLFKHGYIEKGEREAVYVNTKVNPGDRVVMFFEPLPDSIRAFNYVEGTGVRDVRTIIGIRLDDQSYRSLNLLPSTIEQREHLLPFEAKAQPDTATLSIDFNMPVMVSSTSSLGTNQWSENNWGYDFNIDSLSQASGSFVNILPSVINISVNNRNYPWVTTPGSKTRIAFDAPGYSEAIENGIPESEAFKQSLKIFDSPLPEIYTARDHIYYKWDFISKFGNIPFKAYSDSLRVQLKQRKTQISEIPDISGAEREYLELFVERRYIQELSNFLWMKENVDKANEEEMATYQADYSLLDPTASELLFAKSPAAIYLVNEDGDRKKTADYLKINGLYDSPFVKTVDLYFNTLDSIKKATSQTKENTLLGIRETPDCEPSKILETIVSEHRGKTVLVDFWATWCGPCMMGMKKMEPYKEQLMGKGVDFVYITDETSPFKAWENVIPNHKGSHYRIPTAIYKDINIPGYEGGIPHYLIYKPDGTLSSSISGWTSEENMLKLIEEAIAGSSE